MARKGMTRAQWVKRMSKLYKAHNGCCYYCNSRVLVFVNVEGTRPKPNSATIDHFIPLSRGGVDHYDNLVLSCYRCNSSKGNTMPDLFMFNARTDQLRSAMQLP
jgi:5-methylcytosine-specific restriction endonuclease McrA